MPTSNTENNFVIDCYLYLNELDLASQTFWGSLKYAFTQCIANILHSNRILDRIRKSADAIKEFSKANESPNIPHELLYKIGEQIDQTFAQSAKTPPIIGDQFMYFDFLAPFALRQSRKASSYTPAKQNLGAPAAAPLLHDLLRLYKKLLRAFIPAPEIVSLGPNEKPVKEEMKVSFNLCDYPKKLSSFIDTTKGYDFPLRKAISSAVSKQPPPTAQTQTHSDSSSTPQLVAARLNEAATSSKTNIPPSTPLDIIAIRSNWEKEQKSTHPNWEFSIWRDGPKWEQHMSQLLPPIPQPTKQSI